MFGFGAAVQVRSTFQLETLKPLTLTLVATLLIEPLLAALLDAPPPAPQKIKAVNPTIGAEKHYKTILGVPYYYIYTITGPQTLV